MDDTELRYETALIAAQKLLGSQQNAERWLNEMVRALEARPVDLLSSDEGLEAVLMIIGRLEHGIVT